MAITAPTYVTGRRLWLLAMPRSVRPAAQLGIQGGDPGFIPGQISALTSSGSPTGTMAIHSGGPTDAFAVDVNCVLGGALGTATYRYRLQSTDPWSATMVTPADGIVELTESGILALLGGTFFAGETHSFTTTESPQQKALRDSIALEIDRVLRTRGALPVDEVGADIELLAARCVAWEMLGLRGYNPKSQHDQIILHRAQRAWRSIKKIREEIEQGAWSGQGTPAGVVASSYPRQGAGDASGSGLW